CNTNNCSCTSAYNGGIPSQRKSFYNRLSMSWVRGMGKKRGRTVLKETELLDGIYVLVAEHRPSSQFKRK
ncbi:MAG: hypothetical protein RJQ14_13455, partial [Marinoscillum sp.]